VKWEDEDGRRHKKRVSVGEIVDPDTFRDRLPIRRLSRAVDENGNPLRGGCHFREGDVVEFESF